MNFHDSQRYKYAFVKNELLKFNSFLVLDIAKKYPPSLRLIVFATNLSNLKIGTLYIVTYIGGTLGREGDHDVIIPDTNVSKVRRLNHFFVVFILIFFYFSVI